MDCIDDNLNMLVHLSNVSSLYNKQWQIHFQKKCKSDGNLAQFLLVTLSPLFKFLISYVSFDFFCKDEKVPG